VPAMAMDDHGFAYCTWRDGRSGQFEIYFTSDQTVKSIVTLLAPRGARSGILTQRAPSNGKPCGRESPWSV